MNNSDRNSTGNSDGSNARSRPEQSGETSGDSSDQSGEPTSRTPNSSNRRHRTELGIFERFMDHFLGAHRHHSRGDHHHTPGSEASPSGDPLRRPRNSPLGGSSDSAANDDSTTTSSVRSGLYSAFRPDPSARNGAPDNTSSASVTASAEAPTSGASIANIEGDNARAIIITVNYVFSDENDPQNPNRAGSLIMSLPNNSSNRNPRVIQEFIGLATQMAYSSIIQGLNKEKGITFKKFESFPQVSEEKLGDCHECAICFEKFDKISKEKEEALDDIDEHVPVKKRMTPTGATTTATSSNSREASAEPAPTNTPPNNPKYLSDFRGNFDHTPIEMPCNHIFGKDCLFEWLKSHTTCPLCRDSVAEPNSSEERTRNVSTFNFPTGDIQGLTNTNLEIDTGSTASDNGRGFRRVLRSGTAVPEQDLEDNSSISHILSYLRRPRGGLVPPEPLFPVGLSSRRTERGIETVSTQDATDEVLDFMNLRSLVDENMGATSTSSEDPTSEQGTNAQDENLERDTQASNEDSSQH